MPIVELILSAVATALALAFLAAVFYAIRFRLRLRYFTEKLDISDRVILITGANAGLGYATTKELLRLGATRVVMACRDIQRGFAARRRLAFELASEAPDGGVKPFEVEQRVFVRVLDLASLASVRAFADAFLREFDRLDVLILNAGCAAPRTRSLTKDGLEVGLQTNHVGHFLLTNLLLDLLKRTGERFPPRRSRVVVLSSQLHMRAQKDFLKDPQLERPHAYTSYKSYANSKLANVLFMRELARRLEASPVAVYAVHPGLVSTDIFNNTRSIFRFFIYTAGLVILKTPTQGAQCTLHCALSSEAEGVTGRYWINCLPRELTGAARDAEGARTLWRKSEQWAGIGLEGADAKTDK